MRLHATGLRLRLALRRALVLVPVILGGDTYGASPTPSTPHVRPRSLGQHGRAAVVPFTMTYLECFKTTEMGEDEIYLVVAGKFADGTTFKRRYPDETSHWDLNDGEDDPPLRNQKLLDLEIPDSTSVDITVAVMEEDGGSVGQWTEIGGGILAFIDGGMVGSVLGSIMGVLPNIQDTDDFIGAFSVHVMNAGGGIIGARITPRDRVVDSSDPSKYWLTWDIRMNGDGSDYASSWSLNP